MPLFYQHNINATIKLAVWHITENEDFFLEKVSIQKEIMHPHKRLQHLAGRYLLEILHPGFPFQLIEIAESKKPLLSNGEIHFSISHCGEYAAAIISENKLAGIDVELITPKIEMVKERFLTENELKLSKTTVNVPDIMDYKVLTLFWSAKEAIYKWYGRGALSFKRNMGMDKLFLENEKGFINAHFIKDERIELKIEFRFFEKLCLAWVVA
ncbi:MAG TPA: 4'-phosphopantetheinyl transferase superfamily protein [Hanamia sp.]|nr:4'-phosphopantetheinyl transferase superfamily protein [Hanamia sp.]